MPSDRSGCGIPLAAVRAWLAEGSDWARWNWT